MVVALVIDDLECNGCRSTEGRHEALHSTWRAEKLNVCFLVDIATCRSPADLGICAGEPIDPRLGVDGEEALPVSLNELIQNLSSLALNDVSCDWTPAYQHQRSGMLAIRSQRTMHQQMLRDTITSGLAKEPGRTSLP